MAAANTCVLCNANFPSKKELQEHFRQHASNPPQIESIPKSTNDNVATFAPPSECELCGKACLNVKSYWQHYQRFHPDWRGVDCPHCGKHFLHNSHYIRHKNEFHLDDTDEMVYHNCPQCTSKFNNEVAVEYHMLCHSHVRQIETLVQEQCAIADSRKVQRANSAFTLRASHCKLCDCQFATSTALAQHLVVHGLFLCLICGTEMATDQQFMAHQSVHLATEPAKPPPKKRSRKKFTKKKKSSVKASVRKSL